MRKNSRWCHLMLGVICVFGVLGTAAKAQDRKYASFHHEGLVQDWTRHHVAYTMYGPLQSILAAQHDRRAIDSWMAALRKDQDWGKHRGKHSTTPTDHRDWSISLGAGSTAPAMYPAKFTFDTGATPNCTTDFVVFPVNVTGTTTQPNIVAFNNLYSGTVPAAGICNRTPSGADTGVAATTLWSYNIEGITGGGSVTTSPVLSLDGTKVAFVETAPGSPAHFHVLAWKSGDGQNIGNLQNVLTPVTITSATPFATSAPVAGSGTVTDLPLGVSTTGTSTLSSPFVNYALDVAYVGNDIGTLYRVKDVFCDIDPACFGGTPPAPSLDTTWGTGGGLTVCAGKLTGAVVDGVTGNIFVGCSDGKLYGFTSAGVGIAGSPLIVGDGTATGGIVDPPMIDAVNGFVYVTSAPASGGVLVQASTSNLGTTSVATLGAGGLFNLHSPSFNSAYFTSPTPANWLILILGVDPADINDALYGVTFGPGHVMTAGAATPQEIAGTAPVEYSPTTEFLNGATDELFLSALTAAPTPNFAVFNITAFPTVTGADIAEPDGTSGIVVDNASASNQASSVYFGTVTTNDAVKLTQVGLN